MTALYEIFGQVVILFAFVAVGFGLAKGGLVNAAHSGILSKLLVYVFLPSNIFKTFAGSFDTEYLKENWQLPAVSFISIAVIAVVSYFASRLFSRENYERSVFEYSLAIPNSGYMGYPLAEALLGAAGLMNMMLFAVPVYLYIYTYGYARLTKRALTPKKLINPVTVAMVLGILFGLSGLTLPELPMTFLKNASSCMGPVSMLLAGITVSEFGLKAMFAEKRAYVLSALRLVIIPLLVGGFSYLSFGREVAQIAAMYFAMPCGLNSIVFAKSVGEPCKSAASLVFVSTLLGIVCIPLVLFVFGIGT